MSDKKTELQHPIMVGTFSDRESAERAYDAIAARGYKSDETHVLMSDETRKRLFVKDGHETAMGNKALSVSLSLAVGIPDTRAPVPPARRRPEHDESARSREVPWTARARDTP